MQRKTWPSKKRKPFKDNRPLNEKPRKRKKDVSNCDSVAKKKRRDEDWQQQRPPEEHEELEQPEELEAQPGREVLQELGAQLPHLQAERRAYQVAEPLTSAEGLVRVELEGHNEAKSGHSRFNDIYPIDLLIIISS